MSPTTRDAPPWVVLAFVFGASIAGFIVLWRLAERVKSSEEQLAAMVDHTQVSASIFWRDGHPYYVERAKGESATEWAKRAHRVILQPESTLCTTLHNCGPFQEITICTPCMVGENQAHCQVRHDEEVAAFCDEFNCDECKDK